jgi:hypothetical protein
MNNTKQLQKIFQGLSQKLQADFEFLSNQLAHSLSKGEAREFVIKELLRQYLPAKLGLEKGIVISSVENELPSKQIDIVIYDKLNTPVLYAAENLRIFPIEGVYAVIEVKSFLNSKQLEDAVKNIRSVKRMSKKAFVEQKSAVIPYVNLYGKQNYDHVPVIGFIFSYSAIKNIKVLKNKIEQGDDLENLKNNIDTICILNNAVITNQNIENCKIVATKEPNTRRGFLKNSDSLLLFYLLMMTVLPQTWMRPINMTEYAQKITFGNFET